MYRDLWDKLVEWFIDANMIPCSCGSKDDHWNVKDSIEGIVCEAEVVCDNCGKVVNYWAYGNLESPETYTELIKWNLTNFLYKFNLVRRYQNWRFNRSIRKGGF